MNGVPAALGDKADAEKDAIAVDGKPLPKAESFRYLMLHKPRGYVTTLSDERGRKTVADLVADAGVRVYPVGRLDRDSEGLLLLTNDGALAQRLTHPSHEIEKTYRVTVGEPVTPERLSALGRPFLLDGYRTRPAAVRLLAPNELELTLHEGRNRQIRRMCEAAGLRVLRLRRTQEGTLRLGMLPSGKWRELTKEEIESLNGE